MKLSYPFATVVEIILHGAPFRAPLKVRARTIEGSTLVNAGRRVSTGIRHREMCAQMVSEPSAFLFPHVALASDLVHHWTAMLAGAPVIHAAIT